MDSKSFDQVARFFAGSRLSRRSALRRGGAGVAAGLLGGLAAGRATAQEATPVASPVAGDDEQGAAHPAFLFVQSFGSGSIAPAGDGTGAHTVTLEQGSGQTVFFSDRPERIVGAAPTERVLDQLGFSPENPPNAALVVDGGSGETTIAVVELTNAVYDPDGASVTYDVTPLAEWENSVDLGFTEAPGALDTIPGSFGNAHLFIDDCPDSTLYCVQLDPNNYGGRLMGTFGHCFQWSDLSCRLCEEKSYYVDLCNDRFPDLCPGRSGGSGTCELAYIVGGSILDDNLDFR